MKGALSNSYTMCCPPVRGDNPRALASGLPNVQVDKRGKIIIEPVHEISNNVVCATSKASDQPVHMRSLIRAFASRLAIL